MLKAITEVVDKDVTMLEGADAQFVSLVKHGANRMPFRVVKEEQGEVKGMLSIQAIILPKDVSMEDLTSQEGFEFLAEAKTDKVKKYDGYKKVLQAPMSDFEDSSLKMIKAGPGYLVVGNAKSPENENLLTLSKEQVDKIVSLATPMDAVIDEDGSATTQNALAVSFRDMYEKELWSMLDVLNGSLNQSSTEPEARKAAVLSAVDGFKSFLSMGLDAIGGSSAKIEKTQKDEGGNKMTKEEIQALVTETVTAVLDEREKAAKEAADKAKEEQEEADAKAAADKAKADADAEAKKTATTTDADATTEKTEKLDEVLKEVKGIGDRVAKLEKADGDQLATDATDKEDPKVVKKDDEVEKNDSVFHGVIFKREAA